MTGPEPRRLSLASALAAVVTSDPPARPVRHGGGARVVVDPDPLPRHDTNRIHRIPLHVQDELKNAAAARRARRRARNLANPNLQTT